MTQYQEAVISLAQDIIDTTEDRDDLAANIDRYMEDVTVAVREAAETVAKKTWPKQCFCVEYSYLYTGGDYSGVGEFLYVPFRLYDLLLEQKEQDEDVTVKICVRSFNIDPIHIINYNLDEKYDELGNPWTEEEHGFE